MDNAIPGFNADLHAALKVGFPYGRISSAARDFYPVYVRKCNEYRYAMDFFEVLFTYLIGCGFKRKRIVGYFERVRSNIGNLVRTAANGPEGGNGEGKGG